MGAPILQVRLRKPGLFVTGTDTGVGKTLVTCVIARQLHRAGMRVGVCKPLATGCRPGPCGLVSDDAQALALLAGCDAPLEVVNPVRYELPLSPAAAAVQTGRPVDLAAVGRSLGLLDDSSDVMLVEGIGGLMVPILGDNPGVTVLDLIASIGYPALVVTRAGLGTLNHTAMTVRLLRAAGCKVVGLVVNGYPSDDSAKDVSISSNPRWLAEMNQAPILATAPLGTVALEKGLIDPEVAAGLEACHWAGWLERSAPGKGI